MIKGMPAGMRPGGRDAPPAAADDGAVGNDAPHRGAVQVRAIAMRSSLHRSRTWLALLLLLAAAGCAGEAGWIHAKAALAQVLLERAWTRSLADQTSHRPWAWADTTPVARLAAPARGVSQIVLAGDSGRTLAFGPGWAQASAMPGTRGTTVISGHRDTHFAWLRELAVGDRVEIAGRSGTRAYRVASARVADARSERIAVDAGDALLLVTCWPFDAVATGGPLRYLVTAVPEA